MMTGMRRRPAWNLPRTFGLASCAAVLVCGLLLAGTSGARKASPVKLTVEVNGDLLIHGPVWQRAQQDGHGNYDFSPMLREIAPYIKSADLAICHIETPMTPRPPHGYPVFNTPTQLARAIKQAGWRICDTASNHSLDQGQYGIDQTGRGARPRRRPAHRLVRLGGGPEAARCW